jgi:VWFA-related protein
LQPPSKGVDGALKFVRERLLPQDQVAVLAYNRATDFTTDHEKIAQVLERFKRNHVRIEALLRQQFSGLAAVYGSKAIPRSLQRGIDEIFRGPGAPEFREVPPDVLPDSKRMADDVRRNTDALLRAEILATREPGPFDATDLREAERIDLSFEDYVSTNAQSMQDLGNLYTGIQYLRYIEGEKHLVFVTENGISLPRLEDDKSVAAVANDARVVIDTIQTAGVVGAPRPTGRGMSALPSPGMVFSQGFSVRSLRMIAELTGGQASAYTYADQALARIDETTRSHYVLGYAPTNTTWDGHYRRITVRVNRPGVRVLYRHGYYGRDQIVPFDRQQFLTYSRIAAAGNYRAEVSDIEVTLKEPVVQGEGAARHLFVEGTLHGSRIAFSRADDRHVASLDVAIFCGDASENLVGEMWRKVDLRLTDAMYQRFLQEGAALTLKVPLTGVPRYVKVVVYDYAADLLGTVVAKVK